MYVGFRDLYGAQEDRMTEGNEDGHALSAFLYISGCYPTDIRQEHKT